MNTRKIKDAKDLATNEKIYFRGHAKATYMSDGRTVEDAIKQGGGSGYDDSEIRAELEEQDGKITELSAEIGRVSTAVADKVDATYVDNAIASAITNELNATFNYAE